MAHTSPRMRGAEGLGRCPEPVGCLQLAGWLTIWAGLSANHEFWNAQNRIGPLGPIPGWLMDARASSVSQCPVQRRPADPQIAGDLGLGDARADSFPRFGDLVAGQFGCPSPVDTPGLGLGDPLGLALAD